MALVQDLCCVMCGRVYDAQATLYTCEDCGEVGTLDIRYDLPAIKATVDRDEINAVERANERLNSSMWRYHELLPIRDLSQIPPLSVGGTPLYEAPHLAENLRLARLWVKDEGVNPTASLKDRASAMVVAHARAMGYRRVSTASTGNAAAALAGITASLAGELKAVIFVPKSAPVAKITQLQVYGAIVLLVDGTYNEAFDLCFTLSQQRGWYCRNTGINPYTSEGKKTAAFEIAESLGWQAPTAVIVSVGDGSIIASLYKGFRELQELGWLDEIPRLIGVQAEGSNALQQAWKQGTTADCLQAIQAQTIADSISADLPRDRAKALRAVKESHGAFVLVSDEEILQAQPELARNTGIFAEPAAAATLAGVKRAIRAGVLSATDEVVLLVTGNGLKDVPAAQRATASAGTHRVHHISADLEAASRTLQDIF